MLRITHKLSFLTNFHTLSSFGALSPIKFNSAIMSLGPAGANLNPEQAENFEDVYPSDTTIISIRVDI